MALLKILQYPDPKLKRVAIPVVHFNDDFQKVVDDMFETHYATPNCAALAATQLDLPTPWRVTVIDYSDEKNQPLCLVNAQIIHHEGEQFESEGCMSVLPTVIHEKVKRAMKITVKAQDRHGKPLEFEAEGFFAKCIQHELDHLDGLVFLNRLNKIIYDRVHRKMKQYIRHHKINLRHKE